MLGCLSKLTGQGLIFRKYDLVCMYGCNKGITARNLLVNEDYFHNVTEKGFRGEFCHFIRGQLLIKIKDFSK